MKVLHNAQDFHLSIAVTVQYYKTHFAFLCDSGPADLAVGLCFCLNL